MDTKIENNKWYKRTSDSELSFPNFRVLHKFECMGSTIPTHFIGVFNIKTSNHIYLSITQLKNNRNILGLRLLIKDKELAESIILETKKQNIFGNIEFENNWPINHFVIETYNSEAQYLFFKIIDSLYPIDLSIKVQIFQILNIKAIPNDNEFYNAINALIQNNQIEKALEQAKSIEDDHVLWRVAQLLEEHENYMEALSLYQDIPATNPHYHKANEHAENILLKYEISNPSLSVKEKNDNLESKIRFMLRANNSDNQRLLDQRFSELCAYKSLIPVINTVLVNEDTLITLAHHTASLQMQNDMLQRQNQELQAKIAKLTSNLSTTPGTFFNAQASNEEKDKVISASPMNSSAS